MDKTEQIKERVENTIGLIDQLDNLEARPDFYTGIQKKIHENETIKTANIFYFLRNLKFQPVMLSLILLFNIITALYFILGINDGKVREDNYKVFASLLVDANTLESNTYNESIFTNITREAE